ncbi:MAG: hypothetical protein IT473_00360 [Lysobacter sp.]|nr:hypothetical protein [Lysobacter sp.]
MKRLLLSVLLVLGAVSAAEAQRPCYPGSVVTVGPQQYLSFAQLSTWWNTHTIPTNVSNPHYYVAFHATHERCAALYGASAWAQITGPYALTNTTNGTIANGVYFQCKKCSGVIAVPVPVDDK